MPNRLTDMLTAGGRIQCRRCLATSKRTLKQCGAPAMKNKNVCRIHGGKSTGPRTSKGRAKCAQIKTVHGMESRTLRAERKRKYTKLRTLAALGKAIGLFAPEVEVQGRNNKRKT